MASRCTKY